MDRRTLLSSVGTGSAIVLAGCTIQSDDDDDTGDTADAGGPCADVDTDSEDLPDDEDNVLTVATYGSFLDAPSTSAGEWLKAEFESEFDAEIEYQTPEQEVNHYIEQRNANQDIDADIYLGLNTDELVEIDENVDENLFERCLSIDGQEHVRDGLDMDPQKRAIPYSTGYISLVYDSTQTDAPATFEGLLDDEHEGALITQDPGTSTTGRAFFLHTIHEYGEDGYLEYWEDLVDNDVSILGSWGDAYASWSEGEAPMVVSYSTDQVFADMEGADLDQHQIRFLNDQAYANPEGVAIFDDAPNPNLARTFIEFLLRPYIQGELAERNVVFPATENAELPEGYDELAHEPPEAVTFSYDELQGSLSEWIDDWERQVAGQ